MACKTYFDNQAWTEWEDADIRLRKNGAVEKYRKLLHEDVELFIYVQYLFFQQWAKLKD